MSSIACPRFAGLGHAHSLWLCIALATAAPLAAQPGITADRDASSGPNWKLLDFGRFGTSNHTITRIEIVLEKMKGTPFEPGLAREHRFQYVAEDKRTCALMGHALDTPLRLAVPLEEGDFAGGVYHTLGYIKITTNRESFTIGITSDGFMLESKEHAWTRKFFSWGAAKIIDEALDARKQPRLSEGTFLGLSGEGWIDSQKAMHKEVSEKYGATKPKVIPESPRNMDNRK